MRILYTLLLGLMGGAAFGQVSHKAVIVLADGIPADVIERLKPPALEAIIRQGRYTRAYVGGKPGTYTETPTISAPGYNNMLTGTWAYKHNVWDNDDQHPDYHYPTIFRLLKTARPEARTAIFSTWIENRRMLLGEGLPQTGNLKVDYIFDGYEKDTVQFPHDTASLHLHRIDDHVVHCADSVIREKGPDLSWVYLEYTDDVGHSKGTGKEFDAAIGLFDQQMRKLAAAIQYRESHYKEKWLLVITTDHGRDSITGAEHGYQSARERTTWIVLNHPVTNAYFGSAQPAIVDILPSLANYLQIPVARDVRRELDGTPFVGPVSVTGAELASSGDSLRVRWKALAAAGKKAGQDGAVAGKLRICISYTNYVKEGKPDDCALLGSVDADKEVFSCYIPGLQLRPFYKVVVEGAENCINVWHK